LEANNIPNTLVFNDLSNDGTLVVAVLAHTKQCL